MKGMKFQVLKSEIVSHLSYIVGSKNEAAVIDPRRDCDIYLGITEKWEAKIKYILETHRNEDYVIGSVELAKATGAQVLHGPGIDWGYGSTIRDKQEFSVGSLKIVALHTPGHSPDSTCYVLLDSESGNQPVLVFTGDTLFVGDVGRTDLYGPTEAPRLSAELFDSIFNKLLPLGDEVIIYPAHGAGSVCGGDISQREESTLGIERTLNPVLQKKREEFIEHKVSEHHSRPTYFLKMEQYNLEGPPVLNKLPIPGPLKPESFLEQIKHGAIVVDTRRPPAFGAAHIKGSVSIWLERIPSYAGWILPYDKPILLILEDKDYLENAVRLLYRLGYDKITGYLVGGIEGWYKQSLPVEHFGLLSVHELKRRLNQENSLFLLDVREENDWEQGHIPGSVNIFSGYLQNRIKELPKDRPIVVICKVGNRASLGASILSQAGFKEVHNVLGGIIAWKNAGYKITKL